MEAYTGVIKYLSGETKKLASISINMSENDSMNAHYYTTMLTPLFTRYFTVSTTHRYEAG
jgi:hypothetical protein